MINIRISLFNPNKIFLKKKDHSTTNQHNKYKKRKNPLYIFYKQVDNEKTKTAKSTEYKGKHLIIDRRSETNLQYVGEIIKW